MMTMLSKENNSLEQIANVIKGNKSFSLYIHVHTDIDAIGSSLALKRAIEKMGKIANVFVDSTFPNNAYMFEDTKLINNQSQREYDVAIVLDSNDENRIGRFKYKYRKNVKTTMLLDHHLDSPRFAKYNYVDTNVSSTCEVVYRIIKELGVEFDKEMCRLLISGIYTDTGCLKFSNSYPSTFKIVAELLDKSGLAMDEITVPLLSSLTVEAFNLRKLAHNRIEFFEDNQIAVMTLVAKDFKEIGVAFDETKGITDIAMQIGSVKIVALVSEGDQEPGVHYISFRTKGDYNAKRIAETFGGGGHLKASGCKIAEPLEVAKKYVLDALKEELHRC